MDVLGSLGGDRRDFGVVEIVARVAAVERSGAWVWGVLAQLEGCRGAHEVELHPLLEGAGIALASYSGAFAERPISETLAAGDWVALDGGLRIREVLPRRSSLTRRAVRTSAPQLVAANLDRVLVVTDAGRDFNPRRLERYLAAIREGGAAPAIVVNKSDVPHDREALSAALALVAPDVPVAFTAAIDPETDLHVDLAHLLAPARAGVAPTLALVGSSGVGKSTLVNRLCEHDVQVTRAVSDTHRKGRHTTTRREIFVTTSGALVLDTPGMRELGLFDAAEGVSATFEDVEALGRSCRFGDCAHGGEPGCAIAAALDDGTLAPERWQSWLRLQAELAYENRRHADAREAHDAKRGRKHIARAMRDRQRINRRLGLKDD